MEELFDVCRAKNACTRGIEKLDFCHLPFSGKVVFSMHLSKTVPVDKTLIGLFFCQVLRNAVFVGIEGEKKPTQENKQHDIKRFKTCVVRPYRKLDTKCSPCSASRNDLRLLEQHYFMND